MKQRYLRLVRSTFRTLRHRRLRDRPWWQKITRPLFHRSLWMPCRDTVANGVAIGLFFSMIPFIPQALASAIIAMRAKANVPFAMAVCFVSNPLTNVPIWAAQIFIGRWLQNTVGLHMGFFAKAHMTIPGIGQVDAGSFILGFIATGILLALCAYPIVHLFSALLPHHLPVLRRPLRHHPARQTGAP